MQAIYYSRISDWRKQSRALSDSRSKGLVLIGSLDQLLTWTFPIFKLEASQKQNPTYWPKITVVAPNMNSTEVPFNITIPLRTKEDLDVESILLPIRTLIPHPEQNERKPAPSEADPVQTDSQCTYHKTTSIQKYIIQPSDNDQNCRTCGWRATVLYHASKSYLTLGRSLYRDNLIPSCNTSYCSVRAVELAEEFSGTGVDEATTEEARARSCSACGKRSALNFCGTCRFSSKSGRVRGEEYSLDDDNMIR